MLTLNDGRSELWQWDTGRTLAVDADCSQVHFSNKVFGRSIDVDVVDGMAIIPDILLQTDKELTAWAFVGTAENGYTKISKVFKVNKRNKPADYVFTPTDQTTLEYILDRIENLEKRPSGGNGGITKEVDPTVPDWAKQPQKPTYTAAEVGALPDTTKIPSTAEDVGALPANAFIPKSATDVGAIPVPETATVGQTVVVKAVDENGKPTEWEAVDLPAGGSSGNYVLLNDFTAREVANSVDITQTDDGTPYNLRAVYLEVGFASVEKEYASVVYSDNNISATVHNSVHTGRTANFKVSERYGMNQAEYWWSSPPQMGMKHEYNTSIPYAAYSEPFQNITGIKLSADQQVKFKIKIWGVVA